MISLKLVDKVIPSEVKLLAKWRKNVQPIWHETFRVTYSGTKKWTQNLIKSKDKMLFFIVNDNKLIGHIGFDEIGLGYCYIGNVIRGEGKSDGSMTHAMKMLIRITTKMNKDCYVRVLPFNKKAMRFYKKIGFKTLKIEDNYQIMKYG